MFTTWRGALVVVGGVLLAVLFLNLPVFVQPQSGAVFTVRVPDIASSVTAQCRGDVDCNGVVNSTDLNLFSTLLVNPAAYRVQYSHCPQLNADINNDGQINNFDIQPFQELIARSASVKCSSESEAPPILPNTTAPTPSTVGNRPVITPALNNSRVTPVDPPPVAVDLSNKALLAKKGVVQDLTTPSGAKFALYLPADYRPGNPLVVSLHGTKVNNNPQTYLYEMGPYTFYNNGGFDWGSPAWPQLADNRQRYPAFAVVAPHLEYAGDGPEHYNMCVQESDEQKVLGTISYLQSQGVITAATPKYLTGHSSGGSFAAAIAFRHPEIFTQAVVRHSSLENSVDRRTGRTYFSSVWDYNDTVRNCTYAYDAAGSCAVVPGSCTGNYHWDESDLANNYILFTNGDIDWTYHRDTLASLAAARAEHTPLPKVRWIEWFSPDPTVNPFVCSSTQPGGVERRACHDESRDVAADFFFANKELAGDIDHDGDRDCSDYHSYLQAPTDVNRDGVINDSDRRLYVNNVTVDGKQMWQGGGNQTTLASAWPCGAN